MPGKTAEKIQNFANSNNRERCVGVCLFPWMSQLSDVWELRLQLWLCVCLSHKVFPTHLHLLRLSRPSHFPCWHKSLKQICNALAKPSRASWYAANINNIFPLSMRSGNNGKIPPPAEKTSKWKWKLGSRECRCTTQQFNLICWRCSFFSWRNR